MKRSEYALKCKIAYKASDGQMGDEIEFGPGTLIFPFWNETLLPSHRREELNQYSKFMPKEKKIVMCIIGKYWVPVPIEYIRSN